MPPLRHTTIALLGVAALIGCSDPAPTDSQRTATPFPDTVTTPAKPAPEGVHARETGSIAMALPNVDYVIGATSNGKAALKDGLYEEAIPDSSSKIVVRLGPDRAYGDLDGDGDEDAAVTLLASTGGSGDFTYLAVALNRSGAVEPLASVLLGDRITMKSMQIIDGQIQATWLDRKPDEPMSATPAVEHSKAFVVQRGNVMAFRGAGSEQLRGHYTWGSEVETFRPCGSKQSFWVVGDKSLLQPLRDKSAELSRIRGKPYQPIYIEASGVSEGKASAGFAMDHDAVYRLKAVQVANETSPADC